MYTFLLTVFPEIMVQPDPSANENENVTWTFSSLRKDLREKKMFNEKCPRLCCSGGIFTLVLCQKNRMNNLSNNKGKKCNLKRWMNREESWIANHQQQQKQKQRKIKELAWKLQLNMSGENFECCQFWLEFSYRRSV